MRFKSQALVFSALLTLLSLSTVQAAPPSPPLSQALFSQLFTSLPDNNGGHWQLQPHDLQALEALSGTKPGSEWHQVQVQPLAFKVTNNQAYFLLKILPREGGYDCHACAPLIGGAVYERTAKSWKLRSVQRVLALAGSWGEAPDWEWVDEAPGFLLTSGYTQHGIVSEYLRLMMDINGELKEVWAAQKSEMNGGGMGAPYEYDSTLQFAPSSLGGPPHLIWTRRGTILNADLKVVDAAQRQVFIFDGNQYAPQN